MATWAELANNLIAQIAKRVKLMEDFIVFRAVWTSWRTAATKDNFDVLSPLLPLLMLGDTYDGYRQVYSLSKQKVSRIFLPEARRQRLFFLFCISSSLAHGQVAARRYKMWQGHIAYRERYLE
ncbi:hypothetical protein K7X08_013399 [Anisodus acutangulus]|uniref:Uncharacterized protein n=1 Tax=Anisodus acutangulus TaxID=402998 RepID=A0A9Q1RGL2_9SOLA|nr:hypothetical protein K7X08_013399 [Anisodus acutangulus]